MLNLRPAVGAGLTGYSLWLLATRDLGWPLIVLIVLAALMGIVAIFADLA